MKLLLVLSLVLLASCSDKRGAGKGAASETTNGSIAGIFVDAKGTGVARVRVELRDPLALDAEVIDFDSTDTRGQYLLEAEKGGRYLVVALSEDMGASFWVTLAPSDTTQEQGKTRMDSLGYMRGKLSGNLNDLTELRVYVAGLGLSGPVAEDSSFEIPHAPRGEFVVQVRRENSDSVVAEEMCVVDENCEISIPLQKMVLVDDFEGKEGYSQLQTLLDGAWWGMWNDTGATVEENKVWVNTEGRSTDSTAYNGRSLHAQLHVGIPFENRPEIHRSAGVLIKIGGIEAVDSNSVYYLMRDVDSIVFWAKGKGTFTVGINARSGSALHTFEDTLVLDSAWQRIALARDQFKTSGGLDWSESEMRELVWKTSDSLADLWLDEIQIIGIGISDLLRR